MKRKSKYFTFKLGYFKYFFNRALLIKKKNLFLKLTLKP